MKHQILIDNNKIYTYSDNCKKLQESIDLLFITIKMLDKKTFIVASKSLLQITIDLDTKLRFYLTDKATIYKVIYYKIDNLYETHESSPNEAHLLINKLMKSL